MIIRVKNKLLQNEDVQDVYIFGSHYFVQIVRDVKADALLVPAEILALIFTNLNSSYS